MTVVTHERFHAVAEEPVYERDTAPVAGAGAAAISLTGLEKASAPTVSCAASTCISQPASSSP